MFNLPTHITMVNADHIKAIYAKYDSLLAQVYAVRQTISAMEPIAREAMLGIISSNPHPGISRIVAEPQDGDEVTKMLNYKFWNSLLNAIRSIIPDGAYITMRDVVSTDAHMTSKPTIEAITQWMAHANQYTLLAAEYKHHIKTFEGREGRAFEYHDFKLKAGDLYEKVEFLINYLETATQIMHELTADFKHRRINTISDAEIESIKEMAGRSGSLDIGNTTITLKFYANGNIDLIHRNANGLAKFI